MIQESPYAIQIGKPSPVFSNMPCYHRGGKNTISLSDYAGKWLVLFFYPRDFTFVCPTEIEEFANYYEEFKKINCEIVSASTDSVHSHTAWFDVDSRLHKVMYPVIGDTTHELAKKFNILDEEGSAQRGTFIIDPKGILRYLLVSDGSVGRSIPETLRVVEALQTGERCPATWKKGEKTLGK